MFRKIKQLFKKEYQTLNLIEISKENLLHNYHYLSNLEKNVKIAPVLKSNAYGHGIKEIAKSLDQAGAPFFCVDSLYEAYELLKINTKTPILIMGYTDPENFKVKALPFEYAVFDIETVQTLNDYQKGARIHIFINTGMNREGIEVSNLDKFLEELKQFNNVTITGLMSHLASSQSDKDKLFLEQVKNFQKAQETLKKHNIKPRWIHLGASGAITNPKTRPIIAKISNLTRAGISLYGFNPHIQNSVIPREQSDRRNLDSEVIKIATLHSVQGKLSSVARNDESELKPVLTLKTKIAQIKYIKKGESVGYDGSFKAGKDMTIGILPIGYNDGVDRRLSNQGVVLVNGNICKILGKVSMNITTIDLTNVIAKQGEYATIYSSSPTDPNTIQSCADICKTIPYELLIHLHPSVKRIII